MNLKCFQISSYLFLVLSLCLSLFLVYSCAIMLYLCLSSVLSRRYVPADMIQRDRYVILYHLSLAMWTKYTMQYAPYFPRPPPPLPHFASKIAIGKLKSEIHYKSQSAYTKFSLFIATINILSRCFCLFRDPVAGILFIFDASKLCAIFQDKLVRYPFPLHFHQTIRLMMDFV